MEKVLITGLFSQSALFAIRRFAALGYSVTAADGHRLAYSMYSKHVTRRVLLPDLRTRPAEYASALIKELSSGDYDYYFPAFEELFLISLYRDRLPPGLKTVVPSHSSLMMVHDKASLSRVASAAGVPVPQTFAPSSLEEAEGIIASVDYPVVLKLRKSLNSCGLVVVKDPERISEEYHSLIARFQVPRDQLPLIQRWVEGPLICSLELAQEGRLLGQSLCRGIRTMPRKAGTTVARVSIREPQCEALSARMIEHLGWTGFIGFDYIMDRHTGTPFLIDCNPRTSSNLILGYHSGVDMVSAWVDIAAGRRAEALAGSLEGVKTKVHFADIIWYLSTIFTGEESRGERRSLRRGWRRDKGYLYDILDPGDLLPQLMLYLFVMYQSPRLLARNSEANLLFVYYNQFLEENLLRDEQGSPLFEQGRP